jgi:hypothetical protein
MDLSLNLQIPIVDIGIAHLFKKAEEIITTKRVA